MTIARTASAAVLTLAGLSVAAAWLSRPVLDPVPVSAIAASPAGEQRFVLQAGGHDDGCVVATTPSDGDRLRLGLSPGCGDLVPGLAGARWWLERADGTVAFATDAGRVVAEFSVADGAALESYAPRQPIMTLLAR